jgi:RNA polymerase sigma factor (sigma-70 family)
MDNISLADLKNEDHRAWVEFMRQLKLLAVSACGGFSDETILDEVVQESSIAFVSKLRSKSFQVTSKLSTYMYSVARNQFLKALKKKGEWNPDLANESKDLAEELGEREMNIEEIIRKEELYGKMDTAFKEIGEKCKKILTAFYFEKKRMSLIAIELGYANADAAKNIKGRCFKTLKETCLAK